MLEKNHLFDVRLVERNLRKGLITQEQVDAHVAGLVDLTEHFEVTDIGIKSDEFVLGPVDTFIEELDDEEEEGEINE
jgi:hypothetical protein